MPTHVSSKWDTLYKYTDKTLFVIMYEEYGHKINRNGLYTALQVKVVL